MGCGMWKHVGIILVVILAIAVGYFVHAVQAGTMGYSLVTSIHPDIKYSDLISVILTAFAVIIALAGIVLAIAAIVGWNSIEGKAMRIAEKSIKDDLDANDGKLHKTIKDAIRDPSSPLHKTLKTEAQNLGYKGIMGIGATTDDNEGNE